MSGRNSNMKTCRRNLHFYKASLKYCPECKSIKQKEWNECNKQYFADRRSNNKENIATLKKSWYGRNRDKVRGNNLRQYWPGTNWTEALQKYNEMYIHQNGVCAICLQPESIINDKQYALAVDHCHKTGIVRGLLCQVCNRAEGLLENVDKAQRMLDYMKKFCVEINNVR